MKPARAHHRASLRDQRGSQIVEYTMILLAMVGIWAIALEVAQVIYRYFEDYGWGLALPL